MNRELTGRKPLFRPAKRTINPYRLLWLFGLILGGVWLLTLLQRGQVEPLFLPTPTPTRTANSFTLEGQTLFKAGALELSIAAYQEAVEIEPENPQVWAELARIQTY